MVTCNNFPTIIRYKNNFKFVIFKYLLVNKNKNIYKINKSNYDIKQE